MTGVEEMKGKSKKLKEKTPDELKRDIEAIIKEIELRYMTLEEQIEEVGYMVGHEPFESMYPFIEVDNRVDDTELRQELKRMRERKDDRNKIYKRIDTSLVSDYKMFQFVGLILEGFNALTADLWIKEEGRQVREYHEQKAKIEKVKKETPLFRIPPYQLDPLFELYEKGMAKVNVSGRGRRAEPQTKQLIKELREFLSPTFDTKYKSSEERFKGRDKDRDSVDYIQDIFYAFYGEYKDTETIRKATSKK